MAETAAYFVDYVIPPVAVRQWVLSLPIPLRLLFAAQPQLLAPLLQVVANERLKRNRVNQVVLQLKSPYKDGTTHVVMSPMEFMERLAALVPRPRLHLIRFHGVLAPNAKLRSKIIPTPPETAAERLKRACRKTLLEEVFGSSLTLGPFSKSFENPTLSLSVNHVTSRSS